MADKRSDTNGVTNNGVIKNKSDDNSVDLDIVAGLLDYLARPDLIEDQYQRILEDLISATEADSASLRIRDESDGTLHLVAQVEEPQSKIQNLPQDNSVVESQIETSLGGGLEKEGRSSLSKVTQPINRGGQNVGVLSLESQYDGHFTPERVRLLGIIGNVVGLTLQHGKIWQHLQASLNELEVLDEVARIITSTLEIDEVYEKFAIELRKLVRFDRINILVVDQAKNTYAIKYNFGDRVPGLEVHDSGGLVNSASGKVVSTGVSQIVEDLRLCVEWETDRRCLEAGLLSYIMLPLISKGVVIGTLNLRSREIGAYGEREREILERLAGQIASAVENAELYEARRLAESEERVKSRQMESLLTIANILSGPGTFVEKCKIALECFTSLPGVSTATLRVPIGDMEGMKLVAQAGGTSASAPLVLSPGSLSSRVFQRSELLVVDDYQRHPMINKSIQTSDNRSVIFMPVKTVNGRAIGLVNVVSVELGYFTPERTRYFTALADGIGTLLENADLYQQMTSELAQRQKTEEALRESESRFRALAENTSDVMWELDASYRYTFCSPNIKEITGYEPAEMIGNSPFNYVPIADASRMRKVFGELAEKQESFQLIEHVVNHRDGSQFILESSGRPIIDASGKFAGFRGIDRDVTDRKKAETSLQQNFQMATLGELASGIAHELNNPLAAVMTFAHLLKSQDLPAAVVADVDMIFNESQRAAKVVHNLLAFARRHEPEKKYVDVSGAVSMALSLKAQDLRANNIGVKIDYENGLPKTMADEHQLTQVFLNILTNADQSMNENNGGGNLWIMGWTEDSTLRFSFRDDGPGISKQNLEKIFDPFFTTKDSGKGTGLGLSMCHRMVLAHGGKIWVESEEGKGTTFFVELPLISPSDGIENKDRPLTRQTQNKHEGAKITGRRILVVDDEAVFTDPLCRILTREGHIVEVARDGNEAWKAIENQKYECILMDVRMPGMGGKELYRRIRGSDEDLAKRIIFATGDTLNSETQEFLERTGNAWLGKPFTVEELEDRIQECLAQ